MSQKLIDGISSNSYLTCLMLASYYFRVCNSYMENPLRKDVIVIVHVGNI